VFLAVWSGAVLLMAGIERGAWIAAALGFGLWACGEWRKSDDALVPEIENSGGDFLLKES
jgi:hypothetical protein